MKLRRLLAVTALSAFSDFAGFAAPSAGADPVTAPPLRALGAPIGLHIGTAVIPYDQATYTTLHQDLLDAKGNFSKR
jgi:hypothetical protein